MHGLANTCNPWYEVNYISYKACPSPRISGISYNFCSAYTKRHYIEYCIKELACWVNTHHRIVLTICEHIGAEDAVYIGGDKCIGVEEAAYAVIEKIIYFP